MILVVLQHIKTYNRSLETGEYIFEAFRMPLFFMLSGMFFKDGMNLKFMLLKKVKTILVPFVFFYLTTSVLLPNVLHLIGYEGLRQSSKLGWMSLFNCFNEKIYSNGVLWFLLALFWLNILLYLIRAISKRFFPKTDFIMTAIICISCGIAGFSLGVSKMFVPLNFDNALTAMPYFFLGFALYNQTNILKKHYSKVTLVTLSCICGLIVILFSPGIGYNMNLFHRGDFIPLYLCGILGSLGVIFISMIINHSIMLSYYGRNTMVMLCLQMPIIQVVNMFTKINRGGYFSIFISLIVVLIIFLPIFPVFNKYLPWAIGKIK